MSEKKKMKKGLRIFLILLVAVVLMGICFASVALYAKNEFEKEKSWLPPKLPAAHASVTELPDNVHDAYVYVMRLYDEALHHKNVEGSWHTDVDLGGEMTLPFADADNAVIRWIRDGAAGAIGDLYPHVSGVRMTDEKADDLPVIDLEEADVLSYNYENFEPTEVFNRKGEYLSDTYEIVFQIDPAFENADKIRSGSVYAGICDLLKEAVTVKNVDPEVKEVTMTFRIDRLTDRITDVDVARTYEIKADVTLTDAYAALSPDGNRDVSVTLPYKATERVRFFWYGLRFTEDYIEQNPDDIVVLPIDVHVNGAAVNGEDFKLTYTASEPDTIEIGDENTITVLKTSPTSETTGVKLPATLEYEGETYTDELIVYITKLDKTTAGVRFWEDSFTVTVGKEHVLPAEVRVPINEQADNRDEEEYELTVEVSDPEALKVEVDGKELFATGLKASDSPVTVKITMDCGGHTYTDEMQVIVTEGKEAADNG